MNIIFSFSMAAARKWLWPARKSVFWLIYHLFLPTTDVHQALPGHFPELVALVLVLPRSLRPPGMPSRPFLRGLTETECNTCTVHR